MIVYGLADVTALQAAAAEVVVGLTYALVVDQFAQLDSVVFAVVGFACSLVVDQFCQLDSVVFAVVGFACSLVVDQPAHEDCTGVVVFFVVGLTEELEAHVCQTEAELELEVVV